MHVPLYILVIITAEQALRMEQIVGRQKEIKLLEEKMSENSSEFIVVYGRRRVGKTYLIKQFFAKKTTLFFEQTGINNSATSEQLAIFIQSLSKTFYQDVPLATPENWMEALKLLSAAIEKTPKNKRITLFFDELPWLASPKSGFLKALEYYWNTQWSNRKKLILIVCGSAASWMIENIIYAKGGLHNRLTAKIALQPFSLNETEDYLIYRGIRLTQQHVLQLYMTIGGIPHYLKSVQKGLSASQNINKICFHQEGLLFNEFKILFHSLYEDPETYIAIIRSLAQKSSGLSRTELIDITKIPDGGYLNTRLRSLEDAGFIRTFLPVGHARRGLHYKIIDEYTLFYLTWIEPIIHNTNGSNASEHYWESIVKKGSWYSWAGHAFESVCFKHIDLIKKALCIEHIPSLCSDWQYHPEKKNNDGDNGAQIDLVFDRTDDCVNLCEIKYTEKPFVLTKEFAQNIMKKEEVYKKQSRSKKQVFWTLITANDASRNDLLDTIFSKVITLKDLFAPR